MEQPPDLGDRAGGVRGDASVPGVSESEVGKEGWNADDGDDLTASAQERLRVVRLRVVSDGITGPITHDSRLLLGSVVRLEQQRGSPLTS